VLYLVQGGTRSAAGGPSAGLLLTEPLRGLADLAALLLAAPGLLAAPRGDGHGVLVFPGLLAGDTSTAPLRTFLRWLGYDVRGWDLGRNRGPTEAVLAGLPRAVLDHSERTGRPVSLIGWSLGGIYAREMARRHPRQVRQVITLGALADRRPIGPAGGAAGPLPSAAAAAASVSPTSTGPSMSTAAPMRPAWRRACARRQDATRAGRR
jgi:pimeloyl-ACP methyl ester carboxylesterase